MFDIGFSEVLLIFVIALIVLGPEKLPRAASQVGRWIGRARAMARQFKEQLEEEVNLENVRKAHKDAAAKEEAAAKDVAAGGATPDVAGTTAGAGMATGAEGSTATGGATEGGAAGAQSNVAPSGYNPSLDPADFRADTFSHAHPTNEYGANPLTPDGAPPPESKPWPAAESPAASAPAASYGETLAPSAGSGSSASPESSADSAPFPRDPQSTPAEAARRPDNAAVPPSPTPAAYSPPANDPVHEAAAVPSVQTDNHGQL